MIERLVKEGHAVRALVRRREVNNLPSGVDVALGSYEAPDSIVPAVEDVDAVFLLWPSGNDDSAKEVVRIISNQVRRIVYLSSMGTPEDPEQAQDPITASHSLLESTIRARAEEWTFVRSGGLAANTLSWAEDIRRDGVVREPFGGIPRALVHEKDLAEVAVRALTEHSHVGAHYDINGPAVVSGAEQVQAISEAIGRDLHLESLSRAEAIARFTGEHWADDFAEFIVDQWERMASAPPEEPTGEYTRLTGARGRTFAEWALDHRPEFL